MKPRMKVETKGNITKHTGQFPGCCLLLKTNYSKRAEEESHILLHEKKTRITHKRAISCGRYCEEFQDGGHAVVDCAVKFHLKSNYFAFIQYNTRTTSVAVVVVLDSYYVVRPWTMVDRKLN